MSTLDPERMATLRSMVNDPDRDFSQIMDLIQSWPDQEGRDIATRYVSDYVKRFNPSTLPALVPYASQRMIFDPQSDMLYAHDGTPIKQLQCPLSKTWSKLEPMDTQDLKRHCHECQKTVINTRNMSDAQVQILVQYDPQACLHIDETYGNVHIINHEEATHHENQYGRPPRSLRVIRTARTEAEINLAAKLGLRPILRRVTHSNDRIGSFMQVWQNAVTHEIFVQQDMRYPPNRSYEQYDAWQVIIPDFGFDPSAHFPEPVAAYLIPQDIQIDERVYVEDVIENLIGYYHQGSNRLRSAEAIWTGEDLEIQFDEATDTYQAIG